MMKQPPQLPVSSDTLLQIIGVKEVELFLLRQQLEKQNQGSENVQPPAPVDKEQ